MIRDGLASVGRTLIFGAIDSRSWLTCIVPQHIEHDVRPVQCRALQQSSASCRWRTES